MGGTGNVNLGKPPHPKSSTWTPSAAVRSHYISSTTRKERWMLSDQMRVHPLCGLPFYCSHFHPKEECVSNLAWNQISKCSFQTAIKCQIWFGMRWLPPCWLLNTCAPVFGGGYNDSTLHLETETRAKLSSATSISQMIAVRRVLSFFVHWIYGHHGLERIRMGLFLHQLNSSLMPPRAIILFTIW